MSICLCETCTKCNDRCEWVTDFKKPVGAKVEKRNNLCTPEVIVFCPNYEKENGKPQRYSREGYIKLQVGIVENAVEEYKVALFNLKIFDSGSLKHTHALRAKRRCENFFASYWFLVLTDLDGKALAKTLRQQANDDWERVVSYYKTHGHLKKSTKKSTFRMPGVVTQNKAAAERKIRSL